MHSSGPVGRHRQLVLVLEGELYLIPFALLKGSASNEYLYERFSLIAVPSIRALSASAKVGRVSSLYFQAHCTQPRFPTWPPSLQMRPCCWEGLSSSLWSLSTSAGRLTCLLSQPPGTITS